MSKKTRTKRPAQVEIALTGVGVEITTDKKLIQLGDAYIDEKDSKAAANKGIKELGAEIINRMVILNVKSYRIGDKFWRIDEKRHVKVTNVKDKKIIEDAPTEK